MSLPFLLAGAFIGSIGPAMSAAKTVGSAGFWVARTAWSMTMLASAQEELVSAARPGSEKSVAPVEVGGEVLWLTPGEVRQVKSISVEEWNQPSAEVYFMLKSLKHRSTERVQAANERTRTAEEKAQQAANAAVFVEYLDTVGA